MSGAGPRDAGLQAERTELSWNRTLLSLAVVSLLTMRVLLTAFGVWGLSGGVVALLITTVLGLGARRRHRRMHAVMGSRPAASSEASSAGLAAGGLLLVLALVVVAIAVLDGFELLTRLPA